MERVPNQVWVWHGCRSELVVESTLTAAPASSRQPTRDYGRAGGAVDLWGLPTTCAWIPLQPTHSSTTVSSTVGSLLYGV